MPMHTDASSISTDLHPPKQLTIKLTNTIICKKKRETFKNLKYTHLYVSFLVIMEKNPILDMIYLKAYT